MVPIPKLTLDDLARFLSKVDRSSGIDSCWNWMGPKDRHGRGQFYISNNGAKGKLYIAPRIAYYLKHDSIDGTLFALHTCDNVACVNPTHLFLGTQKDNMQDMVSKGRANNHESAKTACPKGHSYDIVTKKGW